MHSRQISSLDRSRLPKCHCLLAIVSIQRACPQILAGGSRSSVSLRRLTCTESRRTVRHRAAQMNEKEVRDSFPAQSRSMEDKSGGTSLMRFLSGLDRESHLAHSSIYHFGSA